MFNKTNAQKAAFLNQKSSNIVAPMRKMVQELEIHNGNMVLFEQDLDEQIAERMAQKQNIAATRQSNAQFIDKLNNLFGIAPQIDEEAFEDDTMPNEDPLV